MVVVMGELCLDIRKEDGVKGGLECEWEARKSGERMQAFVQGLG